MSNNTEDDFDNENEDYHQHQHLRSVSDVSDATLEKAAQLFKALADFERLKLLTVLAQGEACVSELATKDQMSTVSQRLKALRMENLVSKKRDGKHVIYSLTDQHVFELVENALSHVKEQNDYRD
ncbi:MAG: metalloregulator ArsR/SmtB family transcription factor [Pseudomonadales bacterium]|nr:metalloregulator ArsR/SmtB family transcription factor [Pseudomonadales bacterium]